MKRKILLALFMVSMLVCMLAISASAVDYSEKATLADGTALPIYDADNNPLIWYIKDANATGMDKYASVPNNRTAPNENNDTYVTYSNKNNNQLANITFHIYNSATQSYESTTEDSLPIVVLNLRGCTGFIYLHTELEISRIQYIYFHEELRDCCAFFKESKEIRLIDMTVCTNMTGGLGGERNFYNCTNLHTVRLAPGASYNLTCSKNYNWRFGNTGLREIVIPANVISIGVDNFKDSKLLESIYILGNTTSLGQRNFPGCASLTNIYILGDNPKISADDFKNNFYECAEGNKTHDFRSTGKYFFFVTTNNDYLTQVKNAIGGDDVEVTIISYADYKANPSSYTEGRYIISGTNICDVYYGEHNVNAEADTCMGACTVCGERVPAKNPVHTPINNCVYENGYLNEGKLAVTCAVDGCKYREEKGALDAIIQFIGYSTPEKNADRITVSYAINQDAIKRYNELTNGDLNIGLVASFTDATEKIEPIKVVDGEVRANYERTVFVPVSTTYAGVDFILSGFNSSETNYCDTPFAFCAYVVNGEDVDYICYDSEYNKVQSEYASLITLNTIADR